MAKSVAFTSAYLIKFSRSQTGGTARFSSSYTNAVKQPMGWGDPDEHYKNGMLDGELAGRKLTITPSDGPLEKFTIELDITKAYGFELIRYEVEGKSGKGHRWELHFKVDFHDPTGCRYLEEFMTHCGESKATVVISYEPQPVQQPLISEEQAQATMSDAN